MDEKSKFQIVGAGKLREQELIPEAKGKKLPYFSILILGIIVLGCLLADVIAGSNPGYLNLMHYSQAPNKEFLFGTDNLGRDIFSCIWHGGRISLFIGIVATAISTAIAVIYGAISGVASDTLDTVMMRLTEVFLSVPALLIIIFFQAILGKPTAFSIAFVIGITSWCSVAKIVRTEVRQIRKSEYVIAAKGMGAGFFHMLYWHLAPNFISAIMFMVVMNIRTAIVAESTLSFMGMGLPIDVISWGSLLSLSNNALLTRAWWVILIPGLFLITLLICLTNIGNSLRKNINPKESNMWG